MNRKGLGIAGAVLTALIFLLAGVYIYISSSSFMHMAAENGAAIASDVLSTKVDIGLVKVDGVNSIAIQDVAVYDKNDRVIAKIADAKVGFSYFSMLKNSPAEGVREVYLNGVEADIHQRPDGSWNFSDLVSEEPSDNKFTGKVFLDNSSVQLGYNGQVLQVNDLKAELDFDSYPAIRIDGSGNNQGANVSIKATVGGSRQTFDIAAENVELANYVPLIPQGIIPDDVVKGISGRVPKVMVAGEVCGQDLYYTGQLELADGQVTILDTKVEDINGLVIFDEQEAQVFMGASTSGQKATAKGKVKFVEGKPILDLTVASDGFEPGVLVKNIPYNGPVAFVARVVGDATNPVVDADVKIGNANISGYDFTNCTAKVRYADGAVTVGNLAADAFGGHLTGNGDFDSKSQAFVARVQADGVDLEALSGEVPALAQLSGAASADLLLQGNINSLNETKVTGNVKSDGLIWQGIEANGINGSFAFEKNVLHIDFLRADLAAGGSVGLQGDMTLGDKIDMEFYGAGVNMALVQNIEPMAKISGFGDIKGHLKGTLDDPKVRASFAARDGVLFDQPYDRLHGRAGGSLRGVKISDLVIEKGPENRWVVNGIMGFAGEKRINLKVSTKNARMENMLKAIDVDFPLTGNVDNEIEVTGTLADPKIVGNFSYSLGMYNNEIVIQSIKGGYTYSDSQLILHNVDLVSPGIKAHIDEGRVSSAGDLDIKLVAKDINMDDFSNKLPLPVVGMFDFEGQLSGNIKSPIFHGEIKSKSLSVRGEAFDEVGGHIDYKNHIIYFKNIHLNQGEGRYSLQGEYHINYKMLSGNIQMEKGDIRSLGVMAGWKRNNVTGKLNGNFAIGGSLDNPSVAMSAYVVDGKLGDYSLDGVSCTATLNNRIVDIVDLSGREGQSGQFSVKGKIDLDGDLSLTADAEQIDAGALIGAAGYSYSVSGKIDCHAVASGNTHNPTVKVELQANEVGAYGASLDTLRGNLIVKDKVLSIVNEMVATKQVGNTTNRVVATGKMPLKALTDDNPAGNEQLDLKISVEDADLSLLPTVSKYIDWAVGQTDGEIKVTGTLSHPRFDGMISVPEGAFKLKGVEKPVTNANIKLMMLGNTLVLEKCNGAMGSGTYTATGYVRLDGLEPVDYGFEANLDRLDVRSSFYKGPLTSQITIKSQAMPAEIIDDKSYDERIIPMISGKLVLDNVVLSTPTLPDNNSDMPEVGLDFDLELGNGVRFVSANFGNLKLIGNAHFGGTTLRPKTSGAITVKRGTISYLKTNFNVIEGVVKFDRFETLFPSITLRAATKISNTRVFVSLSGPVENMRFRLMSSPPMSEHEILQLLTLRSEYNNKQSDGSKISSMFNVGLRMTILSEVETAVRNVLDLDLFSIERDTAEFINEKKGDKNYFEVYNVKMGKNLSDRLMLQYTKSLNTADYLAGFEYELTDNTSLAYYRDEKHANIFGVRAQFRFSTASPRDDVDDEKIYRDHMGYKSVRR